ncbi:MAG: BTB/POZ domain-containing protein [Parachlamydiaceae bacterium]|nr:BTB/POZ domain-containing protein [Parachlamydiaceae bacterium]
MLMPALLPERLSLYEAAESEERLLDLLEKNHSDLIYFFEACCDDETWCDTHPLFIKKIIDWITSQILSGILRVDLAKIAAKALQKHYYNLKSFVPKNIFFELEDDLVAINSLLFQGISPSFYDLIRTNCFEMNKIKASLKPTRSFEFKIIQEYIYTGEVKELWRLEESQILRVLQLARFYQLQDLSKDCEELYLRYISINNYMDYMAFSQQQNLMLIREKCCALSNSLQSALIFTSLGAQDLACEFTVSTATTLDELKAWAKYVTHFIAGSQVMEDLDLILILQQCPRLRSVDVGKTREFSNHMLQLQRFKELVLSGCRWLQDQTFKKLVAAFPQLEKLDLTSCSQITSMGWGELTKLPRLNSLILANCDALDDESFGLILASARHLRELVLSECRGLTKVGFHALATSKQPFDLLVLGRTEVVDADLLEITSNIRSLNSLDLTRCQNLTERGIFDALKNTISLNEVCLTHTAIGEKALSTLKQLKPQLKFII